MCTDCKVIIIDNINDVFNFFSSSVNLPTGASVVSRIYRNGRNFRAQIYSHGCALDIT